MIGVLKTFSKMKMLFKGNSSRLELLIEKIQSTKESGEFKVPSGMVL